jgi:hypothetical protein
MASPSANALDVNRKGPPVAADALAVEPGLDGVAVIGLTSIVGSGGAEALAVAGADPLLEPAPGCPPVVQAASPTAMARAAAAPKAKRMAIVGQDAPIDESRQMWFVPGSDGTIAAPVEWAGTPRRAIIVAAT